MPGAHARTQPTGSSIKPDFHPIYQIRFISPHSSMETTCSIIICTRNRADSLGKTLDAFRSVTVPDGWNVEMIVADNGSTDQTASVVGNAGHPAMRIRHLYVPAPGKSRAQNAALAHATGKVVLFTDDDVEPAANWLEEMARPLLDGRCDATAGRIVLSEDVRRPWFTRMHAMWLAETAELDEVFPELIGANMGIHRRVFDRIGWFDEELGPGASGFGEETLLWQQMKEAGMRIHPVNHTFVVHHPDPSRLMRTHWLDTAARRGRSMAYIQHHWEHRTVPHPALSAWWVRLKLQLRRILTWPAIRNTGQCPEWEISYVARIEGCKWLAEKSNISRKYGHHGLRRKVS